MSILHPQQCGWPTKFCERCLYESRRADDEETIARLERELAEATEVADAYRRQVELGNLVPSEWAKHNEARAERYRKAIDDYLEGNYPCPSAYRGKLGGKCPHGTYYWEECEGCNTEHFEAALKEPSDALGDESSVKEVSGND